MSDQIGLFGSAEELPEDPPAGSARGLGPAKVDDAMRLLAEALPGTVHLGTSSWSFPGWAGIVYDKPMSESTLSKKGLAAYSHHPLLRGACIDRGFYQPLSLAEYSAYARQVPAHFRFMVKAPAFITDELKRNDKGAGTEMNPRFLDPQGAFDEFVKPAIAGLAEKAGPLIFQFSPLSRRTLADVPALVKRLHGFLYAINQMSAGFSIPPLLAVEVQLPVLRALWPGPLVVRWNLHAGFRYDDAKAQYAPFSKLVDEDPQTRATLAKVIAATAAAGYPVYLSANNKAEGSAPLTIFKLAEAVIEEIRRKSAQGNTD